MTSVAAAVLFAAAMLACGELLGVSDYQTQIGPLNPCDELEVPLATGGCARVGVSSCGAGFVEDERGGCEPVLPSEPCEPGTFAYPGKLECARIGDLTCEPGFDPDPKNTAALAGSVVVWSGYLGPDPDGTVERPFPSIQQAVDAAAVGATVAIAPGSYREDVVIDHTLVLRGVCANETWIEGTDVALTLTEAAGGAEVRSLGIRSEGVGVSVQGADGVSLRGLWVQETGDVGIDLRATGQAPAASIEATAIFGATRFAIRSAGYALSVSRTHVRTVRDATGATEPGAAIDARPHPVVDASTTESAARLEVSESLLEGARGAGVRFHGVSGVVARSVVRDVEPAEAPRLIGWEESGFGIEVEREPLRRWTAVGDAAVRIEHTAIERARSAGVRASGADVVLIDSVVRGTRSLDGACAGHGVRVVGDRDAPASASVQTSLLEANVEAGAHALGGTLRLEGTLVRDTRASACGGSQGDGLAFYEQPQLSSRAEGARLEVDRVLVDGASRSGVLSFAGATEMSDVLVRGAQHPLIAASYDDRDGDPPEHEVALEGATCERARRLVACARDLAAEPAIFPRDAAGERLPLISVGSQASDIVAGDVLANARLSVVGRDDIPASVGASDGSMSVRVPPEGQLLLSLEHAGFLPQLTSFEARSVALLARGDLLPLLLIARALPDQLDAELDATRGLMALSTFGASLELSISPPPSVPVLYVGGGVPQLTPGPSVDFYVVLQQPTGVAELSFFEPGGPAVTCTSDLVAARLSLPPSATAEIRLPVVAGRVTRGYARCD